MSSLATKTHPLLTSLPNFLTWRALGFRTICSGRLGFASSDPGPDPPAPPVAGTKVLETFKEEFEIGSRLITLETGKIARFANGAIVLGMDETKVLSTITSGKGDAVRDFLPLTVDYQEKQYAQGMIPTTFMRREGAPKERELLCGRLIDRPIRPLFPAGFYHEVQVMASVLSSDGKQDPDVMAANATSAALMLSDIPWGGPIGVIRIGRIAGQFIVNPTVDELNLSDLNLVYACTKDKTLMIDVQAREISEKDLEAGLRLAHPEAVKYLEPQIKLAAKAGKHKKEYKLSMISDRALEKVSNLAAAPIEAVFTDPSYGKFERGEALEKIAQEVRKVLEEECDEESLSVLPKAVDTVRKKVVRKRIIAEGFRVDGRHLNEVRPVYCEAGNLPILHGSALFSRGDTQVLCTVTLGSPADAQRLDSLVGPPTKRFMLHYSFPPFSINEVGKRLGLNRREVGHGTLAEKALLAVLPPEDGFPYTVRVNSEVMASDGSTSMATVCGGSMALMDAGIPVREHVAGVSVGLVSEVDPSTGEIKDYRILTDILGLEDHLGDMDFKIAGTRKGVTAIQLDIKPAGIPLDIICESLEHALKGRLQILDHMDRQISVARTRDDRNSPRLATLKYSNDTLRRLIGPLGALKRKIEEETGARMAISDGMLTIVAKNQEAMEKVQEKVDFIIGREIEVGGVYKGVVTSVKEYGAFVEFNGGQQGLLHISELSHEPVSRVSDVVSVGQQLSLMCIGQDVRGNIKLSLKAASPTPGAETKKVVEEYVPVCKEATNGWASVGNVSDGQNQEFPESKSETSEANSYSSSTPAILIRSAAECDEEEKSSGLSQRSKRRSKTVASQSNRKPKKSMPQIAASGDNSDKKTKVESLISTRNLKLGTKVTAKVYQIRARGLVLDLGGGIRGMYRFKQANGKKEFRVGDELLVKCSSFTSKGIPVLSSVDE
ncbi:polyribonucleotide nucleotidyltransferase 2, mitochondrial isoform X1 [Pistacia vera]|uniref:polyribonucleotide nucleotidyltransferase 2, mitochondrial isoform X1 n=1 Tax=Pistacia vera TaxID=55513 RepID=UPI001262F4E0|nr:polyribonucleotide nucleotidyltransferase 2, mitochondrial isoform X1 [Pistacia vera]